MCRHQAREPVAPAHSCVKSLSEDIVLIIGTPLQDFHRVVDVGHVRRIDLAIEDLHPVAPFEEWVGLELLDVAHTDIGVALEKLRALIARFLGELFCELQWLVQNEFVHFTRVIRVKWRQSVEHLKEKNPERPPVDCLTVPDAHQALRCEVIGEFCIGETNNVSQADVAELVEYGVFRIKISVNEIL